MSGSKGVALVLALMAVTLLTALGLSLAVVTSIETRIAGNHSQVHETRTAAECALQFAVHVLQGIADWNAVAAGTATSTFVDGPPAGIRLLSDGSSLDLAQVTTTLSEPGWRLFAYGPLNALTGQPSSLYIVVWTGADSAGNGGTMMLRADAFGPGSTRIAVQAKVSRAAVLYWSSR